MNENFQQQLQLERQRRRRHLTDGSVVEEETLPQQKQQQQEKEFYPGRTIHTNNLQRQQVEMDVPATSVQQQQEQEQSKQSHHRRRRKLYKLLHKTNRLRVLDFDNANPSKAACDMAALIPFAGIPSWVRIGYENALAMLLAIQHLNTGNDSLVPQLQNLHQTCPINFSVSIIDTERNPSASFAVVDAITRTMTDFSIMYDANGDLDLTPTMNSNVDGNTTIIMDFTKEDTNQTNEQILFHEQVDKLDDDVRAAIELLESTATKLVTSQNLPCALIGAFDSEVSKTTAIMSSMRGFPQISPGSTSSALNNEMEFPLFGRTIPTDRFAMKLFIQYIHEELNVRHLFVIYESHPYTRSIVKGLREAIRELGYQPGNDDGDDDGMDLYMQEKMIDGIDDLDDILVSDSDFSQDDIDNYRLFHTTSSSSINNTGGILDAVHSLKRSKVRFVFAAIRDAIVSDKLMVAAYANGVAGVDDYYWWSADAMDYILNNRTFSKNSVLAKAYNGYGSIVPDTDRTTSTYASFVEQAHELKRNYYQNHREHKAKDNLDLRILKPPTFDQLDEDDWFPDGSTEFLDYSPAYSYDAAILIGLSACREIEARKKASLADSDGEDATEDDLYLSGIVFFDRIKHTHFTGVTGNVTLLETNGNRVGDSVTYVMRNFRAYDDHNIDYDRLDNTKSSRLNNSSSNNSSVVTFQSTITRMHKAGKWVYVAPFVYPSGNTTIPPSPDLPPVQMTMEVINRGTQGIALALFIIIMLATIGFTIWIYWNRETRVVRASQPFFLYLLCLGIAMLASSIVPMTFDHFNTILDVALASCNAAFWLQVLGFGITFSALFAKTLRINIIMAHAAKLRRIKLTVQDTLYPVVIIFVFNVCILSFMLGYEPIQYELTQSTPDEFGRNTTEYGRCVFRDSLPFFIPIVVVNLAVLGLAIFQAWRARNLSTEFAESANIGYALGMSFVASLLTFPILILVKDQPDADTFISTALVFVISFSVLCFIFVPKVLYLREIKNNGPSATTGSAIHSTSTIGENSRRFSCGDGGEEILTTKSAATLMQENKSLKRKLALLEAREIFLSEKNAELLEERDRGSSASHRHDSTNTFTSYEIDHIPEIINMNMSNGTNKPTRNSVVSFSANS